MRHTTITCDWCETELRERARRFYEDCMVAWLHGGRKLQRFAHA